MGSGVVRRPRPTCDASPGSRGRSSRAAAPTAWRRPRPPGPGPPSPAGACGTRHPPPRARRTRPPARATCSTPSPTAAVTRSTRVRSVPRPSPSLSRAPRRRGHEQLGRRPEPVVHLLPRRRGEVHHQLHLARGDLGDRPLGGVREPVHLATPAERHPGQPVRRGLDHHEVLPDDHRAAGLREAGREGGQRAVRRRAPYRAVVGVADRHRPVGQHRHTERVLEQRLARPRRRGSRSRTARCRPRSGRPPSSTYRRLEVSLSAIHSRSPSAARPEVCANHASVERPVDEPLVGGAGRHPDGPGARVERPQLVDAGHRDPDPVLPPGDVPRARQRASVPSPCIHCRPSPASVVTAPSTSRTPRSAWLTVSATTTS